jgi:hypothetical protein
MTRTRPHPATFLGLFAIAFAWSIGYEKSPAVTQFAIFCVGLILAHSARVVAGNKPTFVEAAVMLVGNTMILCAPHVLYAYTAYALYGRREVGEALQLFCSLPAIVLFGAPLWVANMLWAAVLACGTWFSFGSRGRLVTAGLAMVSVVSALAFAWDELVKAMAHQ